MSCSTIFETTSHIRTKIVSRDVNNTVIGDGSGDNAPLAQVRRYSCSVTAQNDAGSSSPGISSAFRTYVDVLPPSFGFTFFIRSCFALFEEKSS